MNETLRRVADAGLLIFLAATPFSISLSEAAAGVALVAWIAGVVLERRPVRLPLLWPLAAFAVASACAVVAAVDPARSLPALRELAGFAILFVVAERAREPRRALRLVLVAVAAGTVAALHGLVQVARHGTEYRVHGVLSHYMTYSGIVMLLALLALALAVHGPGRLRRVAWAGAGLLTAALLMTHTRSAWLGVLAGATVIVGARRKALLPLLGLAIVAAVAVSPRPVQQRVWSIVDPDYPTNQERLYMWRAGAAMVRDHPLTGVGMRNARELWERYRLPADPSPAERPLAHLHSNPVQIAAERGLLGLAAWISIWIAWAVAAGRAWPAIRDGGEPGARALFTGGVAALLAFHVAGLFEYSFGDSEVVHLLYFAMALPLAVAAAARQRRSPQ